MYCWSCGHKNADENKYCAECGKKQVRPSTEEMSDLESESSRSDQGTSGRRASEVANGPRRIRLTDPLVEYPAPKPPAGMFQRRASDRLPQRERRVAPTVPEPIPSDFGLHPSATDHPVTPNGTPKPGNPLVTEPGAIHEKLAAPTPSPSTPPKAEAPVAPKPTLNRIGGPSFLGLNDAASASSDDGSYLLDDEPESSSSWPAVLALTLLIVFGVILVKEWGPIHYFATTELQKAGISSSDQPAKRPGNDAAHHPPAAVSSGDVAPDAGTATSDNSSAKSGGKDELAGKSQNSDASNGKAAEKLPMPESDHAASDSKDAKKESEPADASDSSPRTSKPSPDIADDAESKKTYDNSQIQLAEKYIYGRGVPQDCGRALTLLRSAAGTQNPNAQIKLGALYATGQCVSQDRALAYGWYSRAKRIQPGNTFLEYSMNSLWASMTEDERRRAQSL